MASCISTIWKYFSTTEYDKINNIVSNQNLDIKNDKCTYGKYRVNNNKAPTKDFLIDKLKLKPMKLRSKTHISAPYKIGVDLLLNIFNDHTLTKNETLEELMHMHSDLFGNHYLNLWEYKLPMLYKYSVNDLAFYKIIKHYMSLSNFILEDFINDIILNMVHDPSYIIVMADLTSVNYSELYKNSNDNIKFSLLQNLCYYTMCRMKTKYTPNAKFIFVCNNLPGDYIQVNNRSEMLLEASELIMKNSEFD